MDYWDIGMDRNKILNLVLACANEINEERSIDDQIIIDENLLLLGDGSLLDSLAIVSIIVDIEAAISREFGRPLLLTDNRAMSQASSPFLNIRTLVDYIDSIQKIK